MPTDPDEELELYVKMQPHSRRQVRGSVVDPITDVDLDAPLWNVFFTFRGPARTIELPNNTNPVPCADLASLLVKLADNLPSIFMLEIAGIRVEKCHEE